MRRGQQVESMPLDDGQRFNSAIHVDKRNGDETGRLFRRLDKVANIEVTFDANIAHIVETIKGQRNVHVFVLLDRSKTTGADLSIEIRWKSA